MFLGGRSHEAQISVGDWLQFRELSEEQHMDRCSGMRGALHMIGDVESAVSVDWG